MTTKEQIKAEPSENIGQLDSEDLKKGVVLEAETSYDTQKCTPSPSVSIEDVARVQYASHVKLLDKKRKAVFDWEQFKEVVSIFYGFGKNAGARWQKEQDSLHIPESCKENADFFTGEDLEKEIERFLASEESTTYENAGTYKVAVKDPAKIARHFAQWGAEHFREATKKMQPKLTQVPHIEQETQKKGWMDYGLLISEIGLHRYNAINRIKETKERAAEIERNIAPCDLAILGEYLESVGAEIVLCCLQRYCMDFMFTQDEVKEIIQREQGLDVNAALEDYITEIAKTE